MLLLNNTAVGVAPGRGAESRLESSWLTGPPLTDSRMCFGLAALGARLYAVGGETSVGPTSSIEVLDTSAATPAWAAGPSLTTARGCLALASLGAKLYAMYADDGGPDRNLVEVLDTSAATPAWVAGPNLTTARSGLGLTALGAKLYAVGGETSVGPTSSIEVLDTSAASPAWVTGPSLTTARSGLGLAALGAKLYAVGGNGGSDFPASVEVLDTSAASPAWVAGPSMTTARWGFGLVALGAKLYAVGGFFQPLREPDNVLASVEVLDTSVAVPVWVPGPNMTAARYGLGLAALDSTLYAAGGQYYVDPMTSSEFLPIYAKCNATTSPTEPPMPDPSTFTQLDGIYRMQGATWVANITNADAADVGGLSCFIERNAPEWLPKYGAHPVVARYAVAAIAPDARPVGNGTGYKDCTEEPPRNCSSYRGNAYRVGVEATSVTGCSYNGSWYSFPGAGECRTGCDSRDPSSPCLGHSCFWQVTAISKIVGWECLQSHGCNATPGGCPPTTLQLAFDACPDLCTPPTPSDGCSGVPSSLLSNELGRYGFDPAQCAACLQKGAPSWYTTVTAPSNWTCGEPNQGADVLAFDPGSVSNVSDACRCHYTDLTPSPPPPPPACPHGSYSACVLACADLPAPEEPPCIADCKRLCPH